MKKNNFINKWLDKNQDPEIEAKVKAEAEQKYKAMKTPMQELLEWVRATLPMDLDTPQMIEQKIESLLEKEEETEVLRASLMNQLNELSDNEIISLYDDLSEFFNTKEK